MLVALAFSFFAALYAQLFGPQEATLVFAGDAMMHQGQIDAARRADGTYDYSGYFAAIQPLVSGADYAVVNLETPLGGRPYAGYPCFCAPDSYAQELADTGFDLFLTANNHTLDRHARGLRRTVDVLRGMGVDQVGTYRNEEQRDSVLPLLRDIRGFKVGFLNYTYGTNGIEPRDGVVVDYINKDRIHRDVAATREAGAEIVCVAIHWGDEYKLLPNASQRAMADFLVSQGVDLVIGGHPHVIQPMEMRQRSDGRNALVVYSLGNLISNMKTRDTRGGALVKVWLGRDSVGAAQVDSAAYRLVFTEAPAQGIRNYRLVDVDSCQSSWRSHCSSFANAARAIFHSHNHGVKELK
ncbi:MAG: CapA family protein [Bacteroidales bacterium]|nr:CapA family protein [Bacteroidales bacterium]